MYIEKASLDKVPSNAVILSKSEVLSMHWKTIYEWKPQSEVWPFRLGLMGLSGLSAITSAIFTNHYRNKLKLLSYGRLPMYIPTVVLPSIFSAFMHRKAVSLSILLQEECPVCIQVRAMVVQCGFSILYPIMISPISGFYYALNCGSYNIPPLKWQYLPELFKLSLNMTRKLRSTLPVLAGINCIAASVLTYYEAISFFKLQQKVLEKEETFRQKVLSKST